MDRLILWSLAPPIAAAVVARYTLPREERARVSRALAEELGAEEALYLATCHRVIVAVHSVAGEAEAEEGARIVTRVLAEGRTLASAARPVRTPTIVAPFAPWRGPAAARHLFYLAAGLESAALGEREIQGQLRAALGDARRAGTAGGVLGRVVEEALRVARQVHRATALGAGRTSLAEIAAELVLERVRRTPSAVGLVGVSPMTVRAAEALERQGVALVVVNRTLARAEELARRHGGRAMTLAALQARPPRLEALLLATAAPGPVLSRAALERLAAHTPSCEPPLLVDLAVPPDVDPALAAEVGLPRVGLDEIRALAERGRVARMAETDPARARIDRALAELPARLAERSLAPVVAGLNRRYRETALRGVERLLAEHGLSVDGLDRELLERWAETLARRFAHLPTRGLRGLLAAGGEGAVRSFLAAADPQLAALLEPPSVPPPAASSGRGGDADPGSEDLAASPPGD